MRGRTWIRYFLSVVAVLCILISCDLLPSGSSDGDGDNTQQEQVSDPVFSPDPTVTYSAPVQVTMSCDTEGAGIHYTSDGFDPSIISTLYNGPISISTTTTIKAIAIKDGMDDSDIVTATYTIALAGNNAPTASIDQDDVIMEQHSTTEITVSASDADGDTLSYQWYVDGSVQAGEEGVSFSFIPDEERDYTVMVEVTDGYETVSDQITVTSVAPINTQSQIDLSLYQRLLIVDAFTEISFDNEDKRYFFFEVPDSGDYLFQCSDSGDGDGEATINVVYSVVEDDGITPVAGLQDIDSSYQTPVVATLNAGIYFITVTTYAGTPESGTISMKIARHQDESPVNIEYYRRLLIAPRFSAVDFSGEQQKWFVLTVEQAGTHWFVWDDAGDGSGDATVDVAATLYAEDGSSIIGGFGGIDSGYTTAYTASLNVGTYFLQLETVGGTDETGICRVMVSENSPEDTLGISFINRLLIVDAFTTVSFEAERERWLVVSPSLTDTYTLTWSDDGEGDGTGTVDVLVTVYTADKTTVVSGIDGQDNGYLTPAALSMAQGEYYIRLETADGSPKTGEVKVKIVKDLP